MRGSGSALYVRAMTDGPILVLCTAPDADVAARLARGLLDARLAACVSVVPGLRSFYVWDGEVKDEGEVQLLIKSRGLVFSDLDAWIREHHPYDVPEVIAVPIQAGSTRYLAWLEEQTS